MIPVLVPATAIAGLLLVHTPPAPADGSVNVVALPTHKIVVPVIGASAFTVTVVVTVQPTPAMP